MNVSALEEYILSEKPNPGQEKRRWVLPNREEQEGFTDINTSRNTPKKKREVCYMLLSPRV